MIEVSIKTDFLRALADLETMEKQVRYATAVSMTKTSKFTQAKLVEEMRRAFRNPTRYTLNSLYIVPATKYNLSTEIGIKDARATAKADPPIKWLRPQIYGGPREQKRSEFLMSRRLGSTIWAVPGAKYRKGDINVALSAMGAQRDPLQNSTQRSKTRKGRSGRRETTRIFTIAGNTSHLKPGVYRAISIGTGFGRASRLEPVLRFVKRPGYRVRFPFPRLSEQIYLARWPLEFNLALRQAIRTAR